MRRLPFYAFEIGRLLPYWILFSAWMLTAFAWNRAPQVASGNPALTSQRAANAIYILSAFTALMIGLRYRVGGDWIPYLEHYNLAQLLSYEQALETFDIGYTTLVFIAGRLDTGIWLVNLVCGIILTFGLTRFCMRQPNPALAFLVAVPYLIIVVGMGYTRQAAAIGLILAGLVHLDGRSTKKLLLYILAAALFHRTALLILPIVLMPLFRRNLLYGIAAGITFAIAFVVLLGDRTEDLITNYVDAEYESRGAVVRVAMNLVPAIVALAFRKRLGFNQYEREVWVFFALISLALFPLVISVSFTTAIDRVALFLIPLQVAILARLPYVFGKRKALNAQLVVAVCIYSAFVQVVWLSFATYAEYWVPYSTVVTNTR